MHGSQSQRCYGEHVELTVDDFWHIADAGDQELTKLAHSSRRGIKKEELGTEDICRAHAKVELMMSESE